MFLSQYLKRIHIRCLLLPWEGCEYILIIICKIWGFVYLLERRVPYILSCPLGAQDLLSSPLHWY